jgi:hypothetical protein
MSLPCIYVFKIGWHTNPQVTGALVQVPLGHEAEIKLGAGLVTVWSSVQILPRQWAVTRRVVAP